jgi:Cu-Zn family superoxide dismutase
MREYCERRLNTLGVAIFVVGFSGAVTAGDDVKATAEMRLCSNVNVVIGEAKLKEKKSEEGIKLVEIELKVKGLTPGKHAVHIHETADCQPCGAAAGHFDPGPMGLSAPDGNHPFHSGDLINIVGKNDGKGKLKTETTRITLSQGPLSLFDADGSAFIIHDNKDTYCPDGDVGGCAGGSRFACGIIQREN